MSQRIADPQRRSARSQSAILKAAYELCQEQGYGRLTIEAIAARAGVGKQTIYRWWPSKGALLLDVFVEMILGRLDFEDTGDPVNDLRRRVVATAAALADDTIGPHIAALIGDAHDDLALAQALQERLVAPARAQHRELLLAGQRSGQLRDDLNVDVMADALFAPIWFRLMVTRADVSKRFAERSVEAVLSGLAATGGGTPRRRES
jgi:AcrR family transcriptional regulator